MGGEKSNCFQIAYFLEGVMHLRIIRGKNNYQTAIEKVPTFAGPQVALKSVCWEVNNISGSPSDGLVMPLLVQRKLR